MSVGPTPNAGELKMSCRKSLERMKNRPPGAGSSSVSSAWKPTLVMSMLRPLMSPSRLKMPPATRATSPVAKPWAPRKPAVLRLMSPATAKTTPPEMLLAGLFRLTLPLSIVAIPNGPPSPTPRVMAPLGASDCVMSVLVPTSSPCRQLPLMLSGTPGALATARLTSMKPDIARLATRFAATFRL